MVHEKNMKNKFICIREKAQCVQKFKPSSSPFLFVLLSNQYPISTQKSSTSKPTTYNSENCDIFDDK